MSELQRGYFTLKIIDSTGQFDLPRLHDRNPESPKDAEDIIQLLKAYIELRKRSEHKNNYES